MDEGRGNMTDWDRSVFWDINHFSADTSWAHGFMKAYALWGGLVALALLLLGSWVWMRRHQDGCLSVAMVALTGVATVLAFAVNQVLGPAVGRTRPFAAMPDVLQLLPHSAGSSFPSDHCMIAGAFAVGLAVAHRILGAVAGVLAVFLAFGRVYVGVHYPTDVLGGLLIGGVIALVLVLALRGLLARLLGALRDTPAAPLVVTTPSRARHRVGPSAHEDAEV